MAPGTARRRKAPLDGGPSSRRVVPGEIRPMLGVAHRDSEPESVHSAHGPTRTTAEVGRACQPLHDSVASVAPRSLRAVGRRARYAVQRVRDPNSRRPARPGSAAVRIRRGRTTSPECLTSSSSPEQQKTPRLVWPRAGGLSLKLQARSHAVRLRGRLYNAPRRSSSRTRQTMQGVRGRMLGVAGASRGTTGQGWWSR